MNANATATAERQTRFELFDYERFEAAIDELAGKYKANKPFPHLSFESFLSPDAAAEVARVFPTELDSHWIRYRHVNENKASTDRWDDFPPIVADVIREMNSPRFIALIGRMTGISGLLADPEIEGGGMHQAWTGGFLNVHTDFTMHRHNPTWRRRCNLILYFNDNWDLSWGGTLQLWDFEMNTVKATVPCLLNHAVLFNTPNALHGFPDPLTCPEDRSRKSLQWYYYTVDEAADAVPVATTYYARPVDPPMKRFLVRADNFALRAYAWIKRNLGLSDTLVSRVMSLFSANKHHH